LRCGRELTLPKLLKQNGVKMLAGSDTAVIVNWCIPGFSLHQEFALLAASGLSPLEILQMTTLNGAQFLGREATMGTVDQGKNADLVLLDANPIEDVANLDKIRRVPEGQVLFQSRARQVVERRCRGVCSPAA
jgi:imidazolonepropionase-like amidohydrolase